MSSSRVTRNIGWARRGGMGRAMCQLPYVRLWSTLERNMPPRLARARIALRALRGGTEADRARTWFAPFTDVERRELVGRFPRHPRREYPSRGDFLRRMLLPTWKPGYRTTCSNGATACPWRLRWSCGRPFSTTTWSNSRSVCRPR